MRSNGRDRLRHGEYAAHACFNNVVLHNKAQYPSKSIDFYVLYNSGKSLKAISSELNLHIYAVEMMENDLVQIHKYKEFKAQVTDISKQIELCFQNYNKYAKELNESKLLSKFDKQCLADKCRECEFSHYKSNEILSDIIKDFETQTLIHFFSLQYEKEIMSNTNLIRFLEL
jgi:hypothetical protein